MTDPADGPEEIAQLYALTSSVLADAPERAAIEVLLEVAKEGQKGVV